MQIEFEIDGMRLTRTSDAYVGKQEFCTVTVYLAIITNF